MNLILHVAFVHDALPPYRRQLFDRIAGRHRITFFFTNVRDHALGDRSVSVRGYRVPEMSDYVIAPCLLRELRESHQRDPFDAVVLPDLGNFSCQMGYLFSRSTKLPYVLWTGEWCAVRHPRRWVMRPLEKAIARDAAACLAYGSRAVERLKQLGASAEQIRITGNSSDYHFSAPHRDALDRIRKDWAIGDRPVILYLGRLLKFKGPDVLVEAFAEVAQSGKAYLVVAGGGPLLPALQEQVRRKELTHVHFTGRTVEGSSEKDLLYALASVFVLPSRRWRTAEPWGLVLNEAASAALPIVTTHWAGAVGDLIRDGETGFVIPAEDPRSLCAVILEILEQPLGAKERGLRAREVAARFTIDRMADALDWGIRTAAARR